MQQIYAQETYFLSYELEIDYANVQSEIIKNPSTSTEAHKS